MYRCEFVRRSAKVIIPIGERNGAEKTSGEKSEIVSRDARASSALIWDAARERTLIQLIQKVILSLLKATLLPSHPPVQEGIPREDGAVGPRDCSRILSPLERPRRHPLERELFHPHTPDAALRAGDAISEEQLFFSISVGEISKEKRGQTGDPPAG